MTLSKNAIVVEGGAMRGVFSTGVLDGFLQAGFDPFDWYLGVSSGAGNLAAYLAEMPKRNFRIYSDYALRSEFLSFKRFLRGKHLMDLDWLWDITISECRLDLKKIYEKKRPFLVGLTDIHTGNAIYKEADEYTLEDVLKASSAIPYFYRDYPVIDGIKMTDGGVSDSIPVKKAVELGAENILVIRSQHRDYVKRESRLQKRLYAVFNNYPELKTSIEKRAQMYNDSVSFIRQPPEGVFILEVNPSKKFQAKRFSRKKSNLIQSYRDGINAAEKSIRLWNCSCS